MSRVALFVDTGIVQVAGEYVRQDAAFWSSSMIMLSKRVTVRPASCL
jgi:hypothetical protein